jgi:hypothetical protein
MKPKIILSILVLIAIAFTLTPNPCLSAVPSLINYQGVLKDSTGAPENGKFRMEFSIYNDSTGGDLLWNETQDSVQVTNGLFNVMLGTVDSIPDSVFKGPDRWLQVKVNDSVLFPRRQIVSVGYAFTDGDWTIDGDNIYREQGNVGIGTTGPSVPLEIFKADRDQLRLSRSASDGASFMAWGQGTGLYMMANAYYDGAFQRINTTYPAWMISFGHAADEAFSVSRADAGANPATFTTLFRIKNNGNVGIGTMDYPAYKLDVEGYVQAYGYYTGDIVFQKDKQKLWRMFEDEDGLYLENLKTGKIYRFVLQEVEKK